MTADFGSVEKIDVFSLRSDGDLKVISNSNPTENCISCSDAVDGEDRGENGSRPPVVSNGNAADSSEEEDGDDSRGSVPEADPAGGVRDVWRTDELAAGEKEEHLVNVGSDPPASEDGETAVRKESNSESISGNGDDRHLGVVSLNSEPDMAENPRDLEIAGDIKVASNCSAYDTEVSANAVVLISSEVSPAEEKDSIPLDAIHEKVNHLDIKMDKENVPIPVVSEMELTVCMQDISAASIPVASLADVATPIAIAELDMIENETKAVVSKMLEAKLAVTSEEVQIPEIGNYEEVSSNGERGEMTDTRHLDKAEESNQLLSDNGLHQEQGFVYAEPDFETLGTLNGMANPDMVEVEQEDACGHMKVEICRTFTENKNKAEELEGLHRENGESNQLNMNGSKEKISLLKEREDVCAVDVRGNSSLRDSLFQMDRVKMGASEDKIEAEFDTDEQQRGDQMNKTAITPKDSESAHELHEISATMDIGDKAITSSTVDEIDKHENTSSDMKADQQAGLKSEAKEDKRKVLDAATADIDQHLELESCILKEKQDGDAVSYSELKPISITELDREIYLNPLTVIEDITSVMDDQVSLCSNVVDDKGKQDCGSVSIEADQQTELALVAQKDDRQIYESAAADIVQNLEIESSELNAKEKVDTDSVLAVQPINDQGSKILFIELNHERKLPSDDQAADASAVTRTYDQVNLSLFVDEDKQESESADMEVQNQGELEPVSEATDSLELETFGSNIDQSLQLKSGSSEEKQNTEGACNETDRDKESGDILEAPLEPRSSDCQHPQEPSLEPAQENGNEQPESLDYLQVEQENRNMILEIEEQEAPSDIKEVLHEHLVAKHVMGERAEMLPLRESGEGKKHMLRFADECESIVRLQSASAIKYCSTVIINNAAVQPASSVNNISIQFGSITQEELLGRSNEPVVAEKEKFYIVRVPNFTYDLSTDLRKAQNGLTERTKIRDSINNEIQEQRAICTLCRENLRSATEKLKTARESLQTAQNKLLLVQSANSLKEIDDKIKKLEFRLNHESMTLKEEKQCINELKLLGQQRERLSSSMGPEKEDLSKELGLTKELDTLKADFARAEEEVKATRMKYEDVERFLKVLKAKQNDANSTRQKAYEDLCDLKAKLRKKIALYPILKDGQEFTYDYASSRNIESLRLHCSQQVDRFMNIWNNNDGFRKKYIESIKKSTSRGFRTLDEAPSFLDDEQTLISKVSEDVSLSSVEVSPPANPRSSDTISESTKQGDIFPDLQPVQSTSGSDNVKDTGEISSQITSVEVSPPAILRSSDIISESTKQRDPFPALQPIQSTKRAKKRKPSKAVAEFKRTIITESSGSDNVKDIGEISSQIKEEEEIAPKVEELTIEEEELKKEKAATELKEKLRLEQELKEKLRLEQRIKAKEAEDRKRKQAERVKAKAEYRAQKEAELKEKMKAKKENKKVLTSVETSQSSAELVAAPTTNNDAPEDSQELEAPVATCSKRPSKQVPSRQYNRIQPVPLPLRNKGRRKTSTWTWMILTILAAVILFLLGNYITLPSFNFP